MRPLAFIGLGFGFVFMGIGLFALSMRKPNPLPANPSKTQLREQAALVGETKKMRIAACAVVAFGVVIALLGYF